MFKWYMTTHGTKYYKLTIFRYPLLEVLYMKPIFQGYFFKIPAQGTARALAAFSMSRWMWSICFTFTGAKNQQFSSQQWLVDGCISMPMTPVYPRYIYIWYLCVGCNEQLMSKCKSHMNELTQLDNARYGMVYRYTPVSICS